MNINYNKILNHKKCDILNNGVHTCKKNQNTKINQSKNIEAFKKYILQKNTIIIPNN
jgi:hypothetical protein